MTNDYLEKQLHLYLQEHRKGLPGLQVRTSLPTADRDCHAVRARDRSTIQEMTAGRPLR